MFQRWEERKKRNYFSFFLHLVPRVEKRITFIYMPIFQYICYAFCPKLTSIEIRVLQRFSNERSWHFPLVKWVYEAFGMIFQILCVMILREADMACSRSQHIWLGSILFMLISWLLPRLFTFFLDLLLNLEVINKAVHLSYNNITNLKKFLFSWSSYCFDGLKWSWLLNK